MDILEVRKGFGDFLRGLGDIQSLDDEFHSGLSSCDEGNQGDEEDGNESAIHRILKETYQNGGYFSNFVGSGLTRGITLPVENVMQTSKSLQILVPLAFVSLAPAAVINLTAGVARTDDPVTGVNDWTLGAGYLVSGSNGVIFEAGGDGLGVALVVVGNNLTVYQDRDSYTVSSPLNDTRFSLDISTFAGSVISIRLDADLATAADTVTLTATDGTTTLTDLRILPNDLESIAGGNDTGFGLTAADLAGRDESVDMAQFNNASFKPGGADILGSDSLAGNLYVSEAAPAAIPVPGSWGLVPEPSSAIL